MYLQVECVHRCLSNPKIKFVILQQSVLTLYTICFTAVRLSLDIYSQSFGKILPDGSPIFFF